MTKRSRWVIAVGFVCAVVLQHVSLRPMAQQTGTDGLSFFKNYFITGDYVTAGVGLRGQGVNGTATGQIPISGVPADADVVAAWLYWQVVTKETIGPDAGALGVSFNGLPLSTPDGPIGRVLDQTGTSPCWSSGGGTGASGGVHKTYTYSADVLRFFSYDQATGKPIVNANHIVAIPDGGNGIPIALGASLVVVYRDSSKPLRGIVIYDDGFTVDNANRTMTQVIKGFYQPSASPSAKITYIAGSGQANKNEILRFGENILSTNPFSGSSGANWDTVTYPVDLGPAPTTVSQVSTSVSIQGVSGSDCVTPVGIIFQTDVLDTDDDGLLNVWESSPTALSDPVGRPLPLLSAMGADPTRKDVFIEFGYMDTPATSYGGVAKPAHSHLPTHEALKLLGDAFKNAPESIAAHFDLGPSYPAGDQGNPAKNADEYIIRGAGLARGGEQVPEQATVCTPGPTDPAWVCQFSGHPGTVGWKTGFRFLRDEVFSVTAPANAPTGEEFCDDPGYSCERRFDRNRKDMFRYMFMAHAIGLPKSELPCLNDDGLPVAAGANGRCDAPLTPNPDFHIPRTNTGVGDFPGGDTMVTLGAFTDASGQPVGTPFMQASTILHEFGHNAWRRHGGDAFAPNCQPLYLSSMNYLYQLRGLLDDLGKPHLDLSRAIFPPSIDETALSDGAAWPVPYRIGWYAPLAGSYLELFGTPATRHCDGTPLLPTDAPSIRIDAFSATGAIDWNANGSFESGFALDVNFNGRTIKVDGVTPDVLGGSNDWSQVLLNQVGARRSPGALYIDELGKLSFGPLSLDAGRGDLGRGDLGRGDLGRGDLGRGDLGRGDLGRGDLGRGDLGRGDLGSLALGRGDLGRGDLGGGDLFQNDPNNPFGELDFETATDLARTPPTEFTACVIGVNCTQQSTPLHRVRLDWKAPNEGNVASYNLYRATGDTLLPNQERVLVGQVTSVLGQIEYSAIDDDELVDGAFYTYYAVAIYGDGVQSDPSNVITIVAENAPASAGADDYSTAEDTPLVVGAPGVLANDGDPDSGGPASITATLVSGVSNGTLSLQADGSFSYTPTANHNGSDSFTYKATVNGVETNVATVTITVTPVNDEPTAGGDSYSVAEDTPLSVAAPGVLGNDADVEGPLSAVLVSGPAHGTLTLNANGSFTYTPAANYNGADGFTYRASDGEAASGVTAVAIAVTPVNDVPVAVADSYSLTQGGTLNVAAPGVLGNDSDIEGTLSAVLVSGPSNGTLTLNANGSFTYTPAGAFYGSDSFVYRANDGMASAPATVTIVVNRLVYGFIGVQNLPPAGSKTFNRGSAIPLKWQFTLSDVVFNSIDANPQVVIVSAAGAVIYAGTPSDPGSSSFQEPTAANGYTWQFNWQTTGLTAGTYRIFVGSQQTGQVYPSGAFGPWEVRLK